MNTKAKVSIAGGIIAVVISVFVFTNIDDLFAEDVEEFASEVEITNLASTHQINTECELVTFLNNEENLPLVLNFVQSNEDEFRERFEELGGGQTDPQDPQSVARQGEITKIVFADMIIEEFSINPDLKNFLIISQEDSPQNLIERVKRIDPNCEIGEGNLNPKTVSMPSPQGVGALGSEHSHAAILVVIFGDKFDFSAPSYQIKSSWIHFEAGDGTTIHKHATGVTLGYLFESLRLGLTDQCYEFQDGRSFCTNEDYSLKFFINGEQVGNIRDYEFQDGDRILISYGAETLQELQSQLQELNNQNILA